MINYLISALKISRPINFTITFVSVIVACQIASEHLIFTSTVILAAVSEALICSAGNILNDYFDVEIDKINKPKRILPLGLLSKKQALFLYFLFEFISLTISYFINIYAFTIIFMSSVLLIFYSSHLKKIILLGNFIVSLVTSFALIYGAVALNNPAAGIIPALFAFLINFMREIIKDMEDIEGDLKVNIISFPSRFGFLKSKLIISATAAILIFATFIPFVFSLYKIEYFVIVMVIVNPIIIYIIKSLFKDDSRKNLTRISNLVKLDMVLGLIAIYFGK